MGDIQSNRILVYNSISRRLESTYEEGTLIPVWENKSAIQTTSDIYIISPNLYQGGPRFVVYNHAMTPGTTYTLTAGTVTVEYGHDPTFTGQWFRGINLSVNALGFNHTNRNTTSKVRLGMNCIRFVLSAGVVGGSISTYFCLSSGRA